MTATPRQDDARRSGDALDRAIDDAIEATRRVRPVDLRSQVLARLDPSAPEPPAPRFFVFRPALLPVAGAILLVIGVAITWRQVDTQLSRAGAPPVRTTAGNVSVPPARTATTTSPAPAWDGTMAGATTVPSAPSAAAAALVRRERRALSGENRIFASSWLAMDELSRPATVAADTVIAGDDLEPSLPGAPAGDLGDPIAPMPRPRPIVIPSIVAVPIVDAPPVSTLATPVSTLSTEDISRGRPDPGKTGGVRP